MAVSDRGQIRAGTCVILDDGKHVSIMDLIQTNNGILSEVGSVKTTIDGE